MNAQLTNCELPFFVDYGVYSRSVIRELGRNSSEFGEFGGSKCRAQFSTQTARSTPRPRLAPFMIQNVSEYGENRDGLYGPSGGPSRALPTGCGPPCEALSGRYRARQRPVTAGQRARGGIRGQRQWGLHGAPCS